MSRVVVNINKDSAVQFRAPCFIVTGSKKLIAPQRANHLKKSNKLKRAIDCKKPMPAKRAIELKKPIPAKRARLLKKSTNLKRSLSA